VAYSQHYNISDQNGDGFIDEKDARSLYPQGHGDAWGHYLTALKTYYNLLLHPNYEWQSREETMLVGGITHTVDYYDERKFAQAAASKARTGAEIINLTYREQFVEDPDGQWQGYSDAYRDVPEDPESRRAWGLNDWASRAGMGAYFDWVVGNSLLPDVAVDDQGQPKTGVAKIDRTTVLELQEIADKFVDIQTELDTADLGLNPLGLEADVVPFGITPSDLDAGITHFEQIYIKAVKAMNNAITAFNYANNTTQMLRRQADSVEEFQETVEDREIDINNRLIELYGYPFSLPSCLQPAVPGF